VPKIIITEKLCYLYVFLHYYLYAELPTHNRRIYSRSYRQQQVFARGSLDICVCGRVAMLTMIRSQIVFIPNHVLTYFIIVRNALALAAVFWELR
jgi:hypothetical protein